MGSFSCCPYLSEQIMTQTVSQEAITPHLDRQFSESLTKALQEVYDVVLAQSPGEGERPLLRGLKQLSADARSKLMLPVKEVIEKHTHLKLDRIVVPTGTRSGASVLSVGLAFLLKKNPSSVVKAGAQKRAPEAYYALLKKYKEFSEHTDRQGGVNTKDVYADMRTTMVFSGAYFDAVALKQTTIANLSSIILHEVGHMVDALVDSWRAYHYSTLADEVLSYQEQSPNYDDVRELLNVHLTIVTKNTNIHPLVKPYLIRDLKLLLSNDKPITDQEKADFVRSATSLLEICAGQISVAIGKTSDVAHTDDVIKGPERRADRYSVMMGNGYKSTVEWDIGLYGTILRADEQERVMRIIRKGLLIHSGPQDKYDDFFSRAERMLKEQYSLFKDADDGHSSDIKAALAQTKDLEQRLTRLHREVKNETWLWDILKGISRYGYRAVSIPFLRSRFEQDDAIHTHLHSLTHNPLQYQAQRLRHEVDDA